MSVTLQLTKDDVRAIALEVVKLLGEPLKLRFKKQLRPGNAAFAYDCHPDYLRQQPVDLLPRIQIGPKFTAYRTVDLDNFFERNLTRG